MNKHSFESLFGIATRVFEIKIWFTNKETNKCRVETDWCWAKTIEEARSFAKQPYIQTRSDVIYLEETVVSIHAVELVGDPNPSNITNMDKGKPFYFNRDAPGIIRDKWGY